MADIADLAQEHMEREADGKLAAARKPRGPAPCGCCHNCDAPVADGVLFCDLDCREDWERTQSAKQRNQGVDHG